MFNIKPIKLLQGSHEDTGQTGQGCFMNVIAYLNGDEKITDRSSCVCPSVQSISIAMNDYSDENQRQRMLPFVLRALGSTTFDQEILKHRLSVIDKFSLKLLDYSESNFTISKSKTHAAVEIGYAFRGLRYDLKATSPQVGLPLVASAGMFLARMFSNTLYIIVDVPDELSTILQMGLDYLDEILPPLSEANEEVVSRANKLVELQLQPA